LLAPKPVRKKGATMKSGIAVLALVLSVPAVPAWAGDALSFEKNWLTPDISTLGVGVEGGYRWNDYWSGRIGINGLAFDYTYHDKDSDLLNRATLISAGVTADYHPFAGDFRVSAGARLSANRVKGKLQNLVKHGKHYNVTIADPLTHYTARQNVLQPYLGAGYSVELKQRVSLNFVLGALYAGSPDLSVTSHAEKFGFTRRQINNEIERQRNRIAPFQVYPVVQIGVNVQF
jgi:long-subunit fatty acid transport protein